MTRALPKLRRPLTNPDLYRACLNGHEPAEALEAADRARLVVVLNNRGWTDTEVAVHTRMSTYTATRIRRRLGLPINFPEWQKGAV